MSENPISIRFIDGLCTHCSQPFPIEIATNADGTHACDLGPIPGRCAVCRELAVEVTVRTHEDRVRKHLTGPARIERFRLLLSLIPVNGCLDGDCKVKTGTAAGGQHTNGGCKCIREIDSLMPELGKLAQELRYHA